MPVAPRPRLTHGLTSLLLAAVLATAPANQTAGRAAESACGIDGVERVVAVGDVHGAFDRFSDILKTAGIIDDGLHWVGGRAHLVQAGDVVDRGAESRKALDLLQKLEKEAAAAGGRVHALLGNHEAARMLGDLRYVVPGEYAVFVTPDSDTLRRRFIETRPEAERARLLDEMPNGQIEMLRMFSRQGTYGQWLRTHDTVVKINGVLFLHGGLSPSVAALSCDTINTTVRRELTEQLEQTLDAPLASLAAAENGPLWYRGLAGDGETVAADVDAMLAAQQARAIVIGHTISPTRRIRSRFDGKVFQIDTGMQPGYVQDGRAAALEIVGATITAIYPDGRNLLTGQPDGASAALPAAVP